MYKNKSFQAPARANIPTPATASQELHNTLVNAYTAHFATILKPEVLIASRKASYATVINGTYNGQRLEELLGTENAKVATEQVLNNITASISVVPVQ